LPALPSPAEPCACSLACDAERRSSLRRLAAGALTLCGSVEALAAGAAVGPPSDPPRAGDWLVPVDAEQPVPLTVNDLKLDAKQVIVWPVDPATRQPRDGSRLNRIILLKVDSQRMDAATKARSADGVLAYSAICTHQGCDVSSWRPAEKTLLCFCHFSQFQPAESGAVVSGPAPRGLPSLPLRSDGLRLVLGGGFSESPGGMG